MLRGYRLHTFFFSIFKQKITTIPNPQTTLKPQPTLQRKPTFLLKLKRNPIFHDKITPTPPTYANEHESLSKTQSAYREKIQTKIGQNLATRKFYKYQLKRGQDLIDHVPVDPYYEYKTADLQKEIEYRQSQVNNFKNVKQFLDANRYDYLKGVVNTYNTKKHRYQVEQFEKLVGKYPGSVKGPNPEDDPTYFKKYIDSIMTDYVRAQLSKFSSQFNHEGDQNNNDLHKLMTSIPTTDMLSEDRRDLSINTNKVGYEQQVATQQQTSVNFMNNLIDGLDQGVNLSKYDEVPVLPYTLFEEYHSYMGKVNTWRNFRKNYDNYHKERRLKRVIDLIDDVQQAKNVKFRAKKLAENPGAELEPTTFVVDQIPKREKNKKKAKKSVVFGKVELKPAVFSLYTYYNTLPKQIKESQIVRMAYLGLQYCSPQASYEKKVQILNKAAKQSLPLDKYSTQTMQKIMSNYRVYLTPHLTERIFNMNPEFTWDIHEFLQEIKDQKLRTISTVKEEQKSYLQPPDYIQRTDEHLANLPVDFYDNEDGFWDSYIEDKLNSYHQVKKLSRKFKKDLIH